VSNILPFRTKEQGIALTQKLKERRELEATMKTCFGMPAGGIDQGSLETALMTDPQGARIFNLLSGEPL